ncbi:MAG: AI-2E family transporter [Gemmatimonadota bacterium]|nr:AI-2E family transporter [Gemmatimonadota bacterium]MDQ8151067.1 AI-2E family transporter [Gemmatimonadota bacterium]MDQ8152642.1 AI-2E family transporter [Gemmatimonadota bacterium]MDQ8174931.1 AI-2E family transporter [Gemmatimonadota bacterium]MDQ8178495.1 AI-2E family transporter [Gemmatimonadota bacterium]
MTHAPTSQTPVTQAGLVRAALLVVLTLVGLQLLWSARFLVLTSFLGILCGLAAGGAVDRICRRVRIKRTIAASLVVFGTLAILVLIAAWTGPTLVDQSQELRTKLPEAVLKLEGWIAARQPGILDMIDPRDAVATMAPITTPDSVTTSPVGGRSRLLGALSHYGASLTGLALGVLQSTIAVVGAMILVLFLSLYVAADPDIYRRGIIALVPVNRRAKVSALLTALSDTLKTWFRTQLIAMLVIGTVTTVALALLGIRGALPLGVIAGIFEFIPNVGPTLSAIPAILMGFADTPHTALIVAGVYWAIQFLENNLLIPYLMKEQLDLPPALTLVTQVVAAYVFGFLGLFVAIPMLAAIVVTVRTLWVEDDALIAPEHPGGPAGIA